MHLPGQFNGCFSIPCISRTSNVHIYFKRNKCRRQKKQQGMDFQYFDKYVVHSSGKRNEEGREGRGEYACPQQLLKRETSFRLLSSAWWKQHVVRGVNGEASGVLLLLISILDWKQREVIKRGFTFVSSESKEPLFQDRIFLIPQSKTKTQSTFPVRDS